MLILSYISLLPSQPQGVLSKDILQKKKKNADGVPPRHIYFRFKGEGEGYDSQERVPRKRKTAILCGWTTSVRIILHVRNLNQTYS